MKEERMKDFLELKSQVLGTRVEERMKEERMKALRSETDLVR